MPYTIVGKEKSGYIDIYYKDWANEWNSQTTL
jgi:hypothetical protein